MTEIKRAFLDRIVGVNFGVPIITSVVPGADDGTGGTGVTITGRGFTGATAFKFGTSAAGVTVNSDTEATSVAPSHALGAVDVTMVCPSYNIVASGLFAYTASGGIITSISPTSASGFGGRIDFFGSGFTGASGADIDGTACGFFIVDSDTQCHATIPGHSTGGPFDVHVIGASGTITKTAAFTYTF